MDFMVAIVIWGIVAIVSGVLGAILAGWKNRDISAWTAWCFLLPPMLLILLLRPRHKGPRPRRPTLDEEDRMTGSSGWW